MRFQNGIFQSSACYGVTNFVRLSDTVKKLMSIPSPKLRTSIDTIILHQIKLKSAPDKAGLKVQTVTLACKVDTLLLPTGSSHIDKVTEILV